mgnify:CR=1 FL=1
MNIHDRATIEIRGKKIVILGLALSGAAAAKLAVRQGADVFVSDNQDTLALQGTLTDLKALSIPGELGQHSDQIYDADLWIISPGIAQDSELVQKAQSNDIPIVSEIEFSSWFTEAPILAITGSNGKTTTAHLLAEMIQTDDLHGALAGNVGIPFAEMVLEDLGNPPETGLGLGNIQFSNGIHRTLQTLYCHISQYNTRPPEPLSIHERIYCGKNRSEEHTSELQSQ